MSTWTEVVVPRDSCKWPDLCPRCLRPNPDFMYPIESTSTRHQPLKGILPDSENLTVLVPFCEACAGRLYRWFKLSYWLMGADLIVTLVLSFWLHLRGWQVFLLAAILGIPAGWIQPFKDWAARVERYDENTLTLKIKRPEYAREVARLNNVSAPAQNK